MQQLYKQIIIKQFKQLDQILLQDQSLSQLQNQLSEFNALIKLNASPINPLDLLKFNGQGLNIQLPYTSGSEGSGVIIDCQNKHLINKKVTFFCPNGAWREYQLVDLNKMILLEENQDLDAAACGFVNPLTSYALINTAIKYKAKGVINLAATSALGKMVNELCKLYGLNCLNVIRGSEERIKEVQVKYKNENVLSQDSTNFQDELKKLAEQLETTVCFDPIGGIITGQVFNNMPQKSVLIVYGSLSGKDIEGVNGVQVRWADKKIEGLTFYGWLGKQNEEDAQAAKQFIKENLNGIFETKIHKKFQFEEIQEAIQCAIGAKGGEKIILVPNF